MWPLKLPPYAVQSAALRAGRGRKHFAYFLEMGLGKTAIILAEFVELLQEGCVTRLLVVCPNSLKGVWLDEMDKVGMPPGITRGAWPDVDRALTVVMMNYEACITKAGQEFIVNYLGGHGTMLVIDESTQIKNPKAKRTKLLMVVARSAAYVRLLSGQPIVQGPHDLWSQLRCLGALSGMNYYVFRNTFCLMGGFMGKQVLGAKDPAALNTLLSKVSFRAKREEWLDLPGQIYTSRNIVMTPTQQKHYNDMRKFLVTMIAEREIDVQLVLTQMLKLQQISSGFLIDADHKVHEIPGGNPKINEVETILEETTGKVLIATYFRASTFALRTRLAPYNPAVIEGGMDPIDMKGQRNKFERDPTCRVNICQVQSSKYGFTFLGQPGEERCATTIFYENSFSLDARIQFEARNYRIGQDKPVLYIDLPASPIEKVVVHALRKKQDVATAIIDYVKT
jgi:hypothetical protein